MYWWQQSNTNNSVSRQNIYRSSSMVQQPSSIKISIQSRDSGILVSVADDGRGFDTSATRAGRAGGFGLFSIRERLRDMGGRLTVQSKTGEGTRAVLEAPLSQEKKSASEEAV